MEDQLAFANPNQIQYLQIDHTSRCNLLCQQCARVHQGKLNPSLPQDELSLDDYRRIFANTPLPSLEEIFFCGNFGDASVSQTFLPALDYLRSLNIRTLKLSTNGSARNVDWWRDLAKVLNRPRDLVAFSIDGLADTNHIYRVNSSWDKIVENASAFIAAGGRARWDFIVFAHNEHQIEEARALAQKMGFHSFSVKKSNRFLKFVESKVYPPLNLELRGHAIKSMDTLLQEYGNWENYLEGTQIDCRFLKDRIGLFLDFSCRLWPCTWLAAPLYQINEQEQKPGIQRIFDKYGNDFNSLRNHSIKEILQHEWFASALKKSWANQNDRLPTCGRNCGKLIRYSSENSENRKIEIVSKNNEL